MIFKFNVSKENEEKIIKFLSEECGPLEVVRKLTDDPATIAVSIYTEKAKIAESLERLLDEFARQYGISPSEISEKKLEWTTNSMPVLMRLAEEYKDEKPLEDKTVLVNTHLKENTGVLVHILKKWGANVIVVPVPYSGDRSVYELLKRDVRIYGKPRMDSDREMQSAIEQALSENQVDIILEDGGWITKHITEFGYSASIIGSVEQTKAGVNLAKELENEGKLFYPIITVGDSPLKESAESETATPESIIKNIIHASNWSLMGKTVTIVGFGPVGSGIAKIARDHGAYVMIVEKDPIRMLSALNRGFRVENLEEAISKSDIVITATGKPNVVPKSALLHAKNGALLVNAGSKNYEIDVNGLKEIAISSAPTSRDGIRKYKIKDAKGFEKTLFLVADGYPINLAYGEGTPSDAIDITLSLMAECAIHLVQNEIGVGVHPVPRRIEEKIVKFKLESMGLNANF